MTAVVKPIALYDPTKQGTYIVIGEKAIVWVVDHPSAPGRADSAVTSRVIEIGEHGVFQTCNTLYIPVDLPTDWYSEVTGKLQIQPVRAE